MKTVFSSIAAAATIWGALFSGAAEARPPKAQADFQVEMQAAVDEE